VRTKDVDCLLSPRIEAIASGQAMVKKLLAMGWTHRTEGGFGRPQETSTPTENLSAVRLYPPGSDDWFVELLTVPESENDRGKKWVPFRLAEGYFGLCSFEFLSVAECDPYETEFGIRYARPEMMAIANLLTHPAIGPDVMSTDYNGRAIKRSNKDLGRVVALAGLSPVDDPAKWPQLWRDALIKCFPSRWRYLAASAGDGLRALLTSEPDLEEALLTCNLGLLAAHPLTLEEIRATGRRLLQDAIEPLASLAKGP